MDASDVRTVQAAYPQIYLACHVRHERARSNAHHLSPRDSAILGHLDEHAASTPAALAAHLGVAASTLSAAVERLVRLGYVLRTRPADDRRRRDLRLDVRGIAAMQGSSVLDAASTARLLARLSPAERRQGIEGLEILARAARELMAEIGAGKARARRTPPAAPRARGRSRRV
jgi:MarR family transcriptional regulator, organic hydroperoxide resistance regulator